MSEKEQDELNNLLDSALKDFGKPRTSDDDLDDLMRDFDRESIQKAAKNFNEMLEKMASEKKAQSEMQAAVANPTTSSADDSEAQFIDSISKFLQQNSEVANAADDASFADAVKGLDGENPTMDGLMSMILQTALSRDVMYPAVKEMHERFLVYMDDKREELSDEQIANYSTQIKVIDKLRKEYERQDDDSENAKEKDNGAEARSVRIGQLWVELQKAGLPPPEVAGSGDEMFAGSNGGAENGAPNPENCCVM